MMSVRKKVALVSIFLITAIIGCYYHVFAVTQMSKVIYKEACSIWCRSQYNRQMFWENFNLTAVRLSASFFGIFGCILSFIILFFRQKTLLPYRLTRLIGWIVFCYLLWSSVFLTTILWYDLEICISDGDPSLVVRICNIFQSGSELSIDISPLLGSG